MATKKKKTQKKSKLSKKSVDNFKKFADPIRSPTFENRVLDAVGVTKKTTETIKRPKITRSGKEYNYLSALALKQEKKHKLYLYELAKKQLEDQSFDFKDVDKKALNDFMVRFEKTSDENWFNNWTPFSDIAEEIHFNLESYINPNPNIPKSSIEKWLEEQNFNNDELKIVQSLARSKENIVNFINITNKFNQIIRAIAKANLDENKILSAVSVFNKCPDHYLNEVIKHGDTKLLHDRLNAGTNFTLNVPVINKLASGEKQKIVEELNNILKFNTPKETFESLSEKLESEVIAKTAAYLKAKRELLLSKKTLSEHYNKIDTVIDE